MIMVTRFRGRKIAAEPATGATGRKGRKKTARGAPVPVVPHCVGCQNMNRRILTFSRIARPIMDVIMDVPP